MKALSTLVVPSKERCADTRLLKSSPCYVALASVFFTFGKAPLDFPFPPTTACRMGRVYKNFFVEPH
jgi:hypothetical protein